MILQLGWRNIWRNRRRTAVILTAVVIGVWSMVFLGALMRGIADRMVRNGIATLTGHLQIQHPSYRHDPVVEHRIRQPETVYRALEQHLPAGAQWTARVRVNAVANNARHSGGVVLVGIDPPTEAAVSFVGASAVVSGRYLESGDSHHIVIGQALADKFETRIGNKLVMMSQDAEGEIASRAFRICGIYRAEMESTEKQYVFATRSALQEMLKIGNDVSEVSVLLQRHDRVEDVAGGLQEALAAERYRVLSWRELLPLVTAVLNMYDGFILFWFVTVFVAMGFGLVNTILMAVFERIREFGLLSAIGMKPRWVVAEVLVESFFLLVIGTAAGNALGVLSVLVLARTGIDLSAFAAGMEFVGMSRLIFPVLLVKDVLTASATVLVLGLLVSLYPAVKAARFKPVQAMANV
jgi:ABC-type lipoprotein release transport system permease subunit